eukprot:CAMPEP_0202701898 /NCGR_PEP_ID=MMETSP1385-20130828/14939_1 /ASSEMBLY_ACC=CAM_ASM_000861 /TAXON_ID=933848 /ORGANISM="Elphidium margaritaceum" /LENGTH=108 /DNA_ID=CAMNT_0049359415 /DNA_START=374 /DNA_END=697 /DNA_ORIENTATION=-
MAAFGLYVLSMSLVGLFSMVVVAAFFALSASLVILFVVKLVQAYRSSQSDDELLSVITRLTLLNAISLTVTFIDGIITASFFTVPTNSVHFKWIDIASDYMTAFDVFT